MPLLSLTRPLTVLGALLWSMLLVAEDPPDKTLRSPALKSAWQWTQEERLHNRLDPAQIAHRAFRDRQKGLTVLADPESPDATPGIDNYAIDGSVDPALLLPHELFRALISGLSPIPESRERQREALRIGVKRFWSDESRFWAQLSSVTGSYVEDVYSNVPPLFERATYDQRCRVAYDALTAARLHFGGERFDQFLYEVMAPHTWVGAATNATDPAEELRRIAGGCR